MVIGASTNPTRYSYLAVNRLKEYNHEVIAVGIKKGEISGTPIENDRPIYRELDTVTLYIGPKVQQEYYDYLFDLAPKRVIFNPGTINYDLMQKLRDAKIEVVDACTLVMLSAGTY